MKKAGILFIIVLSLLSCSPGQRNTVTGASKKTLESGTMNGSDFPMKEYNRIVILSAGAVETLYMLGAEDKIAGIGSSREGIWPKEKTEQLATVGNLARPSTEAVFARDPDLVILNSMTAGMADTFQSKGIPVYIHDCSTIEDIIESISILGALTGHIHEATALVEQSRARVSELEAKRQYNSVPLKGAVLYAASPMMGFTEDSLPGELLDLLGVENICKGLDGARPILSPEYILQKNPDFLFASMSISQPSDIIENNGFVKSTRAGKEGNITIIPSSMLLRPSPRIFDEISSLESVLEVLR